MSKNVSDSVILSIDQGTTSTRAMLFNEKGEPVAQAGKELKQFFPDDGWVEHDPMEIWSACREVCRAALEKASIPASNVLALGITNQRETTIVWDRRSGVPVYNGIVWQDRRTAPLCQSLKDRGQEAAFSNKTGLLLDPYFSGTKLAWILDNVDGARDKARRGDLAFGTVDSWLIWQLTDGAAHVTDMTNASRTLLFNINTLSWDEEILDWLDIPKSLLPRVENSAAEFGTATKENLGAEIPIRGVAGDQQAATFGQACFEPGAIKSTYGTGCFVLLNTGVHRVHQSNKLLETIAYGLGGVPTYAVEGSIFMAGAIIQWLRDELKIISSAQETEALAAAANPNSKVVLVPAFTGLGAPYWDPDARAALYGLTRDTGVAEIVRGALDAVCLQTRDLIEAMSVNEKKDEKLELARPQVLRVDGGMVANDWFAQRLADITNVQVDRPKVTETTALGVAYLAGLQSGLYSSLDEIAQLWGCEQSFLPNMDDTQRRVLCDRWSDAVARTRT